MSIMEDCIFCGIISQNNTSGIVYENERVIVIEDIKRKARVHLLVITKEHINTLNNVTDYNIYSEVFKAVNEVTSMYNIKESGYRVVSNCNKDGGQIVYHVHFHVLGGQILGDFNR